MFKKIEIKADNTEGLVKVESSIVSWCTGEVIGTHSSYTTPEIAEACKIPVRQEIVLDYAKIAELQEWRVELMRRFGK